MRKHLNFFFPTVGVVQHWHSLPKEVAECEPVEIGKTCQDTALNSLLQLTLLKVGTWTTELHDLQGFFPTSTTLCFCDYYFKAVYALLKHHYPALKQITASKAENNIFILDFPFQFLLISPNQYFLCTAFAQNVHVFYGVNKSRF